MYIGHRNEFGEQPLRDHLEATASLARGFGAQFGMGALAGYLGLCHDIGKYSEKAQKRMRGAPEQVDHATAGGQVVAEKVGVLFANCVLGHHGGLLDFGSMADREGEGSVCGRLKKELDGGYDYSAYQTEITLQKPEFPKLHLLGDAGFSLSFCIRMLYSCLVDADYLDTERFMKQGRVVRPAHDSIPALLEKLESHLKRFDHPKTELNKRRCAILEEAKAAAQWEPGLYSLTVPTGGGKTLASLAFALRHAKQHGKKRVIYVIPYTSIIEQTADQFAEILGAENVLEHHSNVELENPQDDSDPKRLEAENWDCPVIVTTSVQFFESLYANRPSACRKLHHIANSVIIFDEAQMLPLSYLKPCVRSIAELVHNYRCTAVLCTATQPVLDRFFPLEVQMREICSHPQQLQQAFRRVTFQDAGPLTDAQLAGRLNALEQVLCIVNTRKQAQAVFALLEPEGSFHLSTLMHPQHRRRVLAEIRLRLIENLPCRVVATSLSEAGVDVDFPVVYRAKSGLDSILQAAGRCNREGKRPAADSLVCVFEPEDTYQPPLPVRQALSGFRHVQRAYEEIDSLEAVESYFLFLYRILGDSNDQKGIVKRLEYAAKTGCNFPMKRIADDFKLINSDTFPVLIPFEEAAAALAERLRRGECSRNLMRQVGAYSVNIYPYQRELLYEKGMLRSYLDEQVLVLIVRGAYDDALGLRVETETGRGLFG
ncbi:MAG: CRISPR-associated helicase Cas3', partial [Clostridiales bacterium]|nr:CRISPR-associated helicase Cas3' [Clostridiales bacterium]